RRGGHHADVIQVEEARVLAEGELDGGGRRGGGEEEVVQRVTLGRDVGLAEHRGAADGGGEVGGGAAVCLEPGAEDVLLPGGSGDVLAQRPGAPRGAQEGGGGAGGWVVGSAARFPGGPPLRPAGEFARLKPAVGDQVGARGLFVTHRQRDGVGALLGV